MYCVKCGNEIQKDWIKCPYCGNETKESVKEETIDAGNIDIEDNTIPEKYNLGKTKGKKILHRGYLKYILLSMVTFGIYGIYTIYGQVKDINTICEGDGKESPNFIVVILLTAVTCGVYGIYWRYTQAQRLYKISEEYGVDIREKGSTILLYTFLLPLGGLGALAAEYIMFDNMNRLALSYNGEVSIDELKAMKKPHPHLLRYILIAHGVFLIIAAMVIFISMKTFFTNADLDMEVANAESVETVDYSALDMELYLGKTETELQEAGFTYNEDLSGYVMPDVSVVIMCEEGKAFAIAITADKNPPSFHGIKTGMTIDDVADQLGDTYVNVSEHHYMSVCNTDAWYIAVLIYGREFKYYKIERDGQVIADLIQIEQDFWMNHVKAGVLPDPDGSKTADQVIAEYFKESSYLNIPLIGFDKKLNRRQELLAVIDRMGKECRQIEQELKLYMGAAEEAENERYRVTWKAVCSNRIDGKVIKRGTAGDL